MISKSKGNQAAVTSYYDPDAVKELKELSELTRVPQSAYLREALADLLTKHARGRSSSIDAELNKLLQDTRTLSDGHNKSGAALYSKCGGELFPCDALAMAVLDRSLNLLEGFLLLMANHGYTCAAALVRMQLDNILRFHGVIGTLDPHGVAANVIDGIPLNKIKDKSGKVMSDARLVEVLEARNPGVKLLYDQTSGYVHLSGEHVKHFLGRSTPGKDGQRVFQIGHNDDYLDIGHRRSLVRTFAAITRSLLTLVDLWTDNRVKGGPVEKLKRRFTQPG